MSKLHVGYVRKAIEDRFTGLIDMSDQARLSEANRHQALLSRGLAALAAQIEHPCSDRIAAARVFDGQDDQGLDSIAVDFGTTRSRICLVQAKWSDQNKGSFGEAEVHKMFHGLELMLDRNFGRFNRRFQPFVPDIERAYDSGTPKITLVLALMREAPLSDGVRELIKMKQDEQNQVVRDMVEVKVLDLRDFHRATLGDSAAPKIDTKVQLECFGQESRPYKAMYGTMTVPDLADLYEEHRRGLFARNIRDSLDESDVNSKIRETLREEPEHFWYFSNGITMLCESIQPIGRALPGKVGNFQLSGVSVVNGAQTVSAIYRAFTEDTGAAQDGRVLVRLISLEDCPPGFGDQVTTTTNTQNPIEERDFKSLDPGQVRLRDDFAMLLKRSYVIKRGETVPDPAHGCSITEAAEALAAVSPNARLAAVAKRDDNLAGLWEDHNYQETFGPEPNVFKVWRSVELLREVRAQLQLLREGLVWRADAAAFYGDLLVTHIVYRRLDTRAIEDPECDWATELAKVPDLVRESLSWVLDAIDNEYGTSSHIIAAVRNTERIERVVRAALRKLDSEEKAPELNDDYQVATAEARGRKVNAVTTLVAAGEIEEGAVLEFRPYSKPERREMTEWLAADPRRAQATWSNEAGRNPLQWHADDEWYSPSGLARKMRREASGVDSAAQGTIRWFVPGQGSLDELALAVRLREGNEPTEK
ncbi:AIPR family protein [Streptomyces caniscabiei]|uniref:AIPR family protein n=1 Tax=Streptomyces caniscabiei TaxID=2746961 RepID=UPI0029B61A2A|nr:AIPR family protein [Streptomyces caniscabiei]MDX2951975.1 AIPR family protein [Streptomyces caniscabiei]